jgi:hypothetical protein
MSLITYLTNNNKLQIGLIMIFEYIWDLLYQPQRAWRRIRRQNYTLIHCYTAQLIWLALIPAVSFFIGTTKWVGVMVVAHITH